VAAGAAWFIGSDGDAVIVNDVFLAQQVAGDRVKVFPGPVGSGHNFLGGGAMAGRAGGSVLVLFQPGVGALGESERGESESKKAEGYDE